ncbi:MULTISPECIES: hypothetical protein [unclassified Pseudomonas]|uniref:hypothetical protein n=1 Tax=unclassified Pseudomonas TaxID=196821 RepID=UPI0030DABD05
MYTRDGDTGSLVMVRSPDGAITAIVDEPGKRGLLVVDAQGKSSFTQEPPNDYMTPDTVEMSEASAPVVDSSKAGEPRYIDMLVAYSADALNRINTDPIAYAFAQLETANLGLRNSRVEDLSLRLAAVNIFDVNYQVTEDGLALWQVMLASYRALYRTDLSATYSVGGNAGGWGYRSGYTSVNAWNSPAAFRHEVGHNAGGTHCNNNPSNYNFGYSNGKSSTYLCGNKVPYYSTPAVKDTHGLPLGNAQTADMARVWRENAARMSGYNAELPGLRMLVVSGLQDHVSTYLRVPGIERLYSGGIVALNANIGPTQLTPGTDEKFTMLNASLLNAQGQAVVVKLRGIRTEEGGEYAWSEHMNSKRFIGALSQWLGLEIQYDVRDNMALPSGYYNGMLQLEARRPNSDWKQPINVFISVKK